jgi:hypothetical protein
VTFGGKGQQNDAARSRLNTEFGISSEEEAASANVNGFMMATHLEALTSMAGKPCSAHGRKMFYFRHFRTTTKGRDGQDCSKLPAGQKCKHPVKLHLSDEGREAAYQTGKCLAEVSPKVSELIIYELGQPRTPGGEEHIRETWWNAEDGYEHATAGKKSLGENATWIQEKWGYRSEKFMQWFHEVSSGSGAHPKQGDAVIFAMGIGPNLDLPSEVADSKEVEQWSSKLGLSRHPSRFDVVTALGQQKEPGFSNFKDWHRFLNNGNGYVFQCKESGTWDIGAFHTQPCRTWFLSQSEEVAGA